MGFNSAFKGLNVFYRNRMRDHELHLSASGQGLVAGCFENNNKLSGFVKLLGLLDELRK